MTPGERDKQQKQFATLPGIVDAYHKAESASRRRQLKGVWLPLAEAFRKQLDEDMIIQPDEDVLDRTRRRSRTLAAHILAVDGEHWGIPELRHLFREYRTLKLVEGEA